MPSEITQSDLRNATDEIVAAVEHGECFVLLRDGVPVGELTPVRKHQFVPAEVAIAMFRGAPRIDFERFRADLYGVDQDTELE